MAAYTTLHFVPVESPEWVPERAFIEETMAYLGVTAVSALAAYSRPLYWEEADDEDDEVYGNWCFGVSVAEALDMLGRLDACVSWAMVEYLMWGHRISDSLGSSSIVEFTPDDLTVCIGPFTIPSIKHDETIGRYCFEFAVDGYGMPTDLDANLRAVSEDMEVRSFLDYLERKSGRKWGVLISSSY